MNTEYNREDQFDVSLLETAALRKFVMPLLGVISWSEVYASMNLVITDAGGIATDKEIYNERWDGMLLERSCVGGAAGGSVLLSAHQCVR
jgi:hypothetical protein